jgi:dTMP kinase
MSQALPYPSAPAQSESRSVLAIPAFRKLWKSMAFSSFGDWLGLLATTALAQELAGGNYKKANFAIAGVFIVRLLPAVLLGPLAGVIADRFDRRRLMIVCDVLRFGFYLSIPLVHNYLWLYTATVIVEAITLFWSPAKEASVPNLVPKDKLESANQVTLLASYGSAPVAAITFSILAVIASTLTRILNPRFASAADLALYIDALSFLYTAWIVYQLKNIPRGAASKSAVNDNIGKSLIEGFKFVSKSKVISGLIFGMLGAFFAAGAVRRQCGIWSSLWSGLHRTSTRNLAWTKDFWTIFQASNFWIIFNNFFLIPHYSLARFKLSFRNINNRLRGGFCWSFMGHRLHHARDGG